MATKQELEAENLKMSETINQLKSDLNQALAELALARDFRKLESTELSQISEAVVTKIPELGLTEDCVYLNNKQYKIIHKNSVIDFIDDWRKNYVDDESFVVVINK